MLRDSPCKDCKDRHKLCWNDCEAFLDWKKRSEEAREALYQENAKRAPTYQWKGKKK